MIKSKLVLILVGVVIVLFLLFLSKNRQKITFDHELLMTFPNCKQWKEKYTNRIHFSQSEMEENQMLGDACFKEQAEYLKLNKNGKGVKYEREYTW